MEARQDFKELLECFNEYEVRTQDRVVQLGIAPVRVDILTSISGVDWNTAWSISVPGTYADIPVRYLGKEQYRANKLASGRAKDLADLEALEER